MNITRNIYNFFKIEDKSNMYAFYRIIVNNIPPRNYQTIILGRWSLEYNENKIEDRIRRSNEDHS